MLVMFWCRGPRTEASKVSLVMGEWPIQFHVMGYQQTEPAALLMAARATSGYQRVLLRTEGASPEYRVVG